jgi:uncharacterized protein
LPRSCSLSALATVAVNRPADVPDLFVLDTSAVLTLIEDEAGADRVENLLRHEHVLMPFLVGLEVYYITAQEVGAEEAERRLNLLRESRAVWLDRVSHAVLVVAGTLKARHRISLADAIIAAFAADAGATLVHKDPEYESLVGEVRQEHLPYKAKRSS